MRDSTRFEMEQALVVGDSLKGLAKFSTMAQGTRAGTTGLYTVSLDDVANISVKKSSTTGTLALVGVVVVGLLIAGYLALEDALTNSPS